MEDEFGLTVYERILSCLSIFCSFCIKEDFSEELIKLNWIKLQKNYPYLYNYEKFKTNNENDYIFSDNMPLKFTFENKNESIKDYLNQIMNSLSRETIKPERLKKKNSLLAYTKIKINDIIYTIFSLYTPHSKTDFKSITFLVTSFLNNFDNISTIYPIESMGPFLFEKNLIPEVKERQDLIKKYFNYKQPLQFDFSKLKDSISLTQKENKIIENEISQNNNEPIYMISETIKYTKKEFKIIIDYCKKNKISIQALLYAVYLKASLLLFKNNINEADIVNFQILYDQRNATVKNEKCIGLFAEGIYPYIKKEDALNKSILDISKIITSHIRNVNSLDNEEFKRYRIECYYIHKELYTIQFSLSATNIGKFKVLEYLSDNLKKKFVDFHFLNGLRFPLSHDYRKIEIHMYSLFDNSCNISLSFPKNNISYAFIDILLNKIKEIMLNLENNN